MRKTQVVIEVLDARMPIASSNPLLASMRQKIPCIKVLNKTDLADAATTRSWHSYFENELGEVCLLNGHDSQLTIKAIVLAANRLMAKAGAETAKRQLAIVGIPNVGKSSLLNQIAERNLANTGNEPAVTRRQQRVKLDQHWYLVDTPGMLWPKLDDQNAAYRLACTGTIRNTAVEQEDIAWFAAEILLKDHRQRLIDRYQMDESVTEAEQLLEHIARSRGCITKGGRLDWHKTAETLLNDFRSGKMGAMSLETPPVSTPSPILNT